MYTGYIYIYNMNTYMYTGYIHTYNAYLAMKGLPLSLRRFYTDAFTETLLHTDTFTHRHFYTQTLLHTDALTLYTTESFTHRSFYTQHTEALTQTRLHTEEIAILPQFLTIEPHFVRKGCAG